MRWTQYTRNPKVWHSTELIRVCPRNRSVVAPTGVLKHRSGRACPRNRSVVAPTGVPKHRSGRACPRNRSVVAPTGVPKHRSGRVCPRNRSVVASTIVSKHRSRRPLIHSSVLGSHTIICLSKLITYLNHILCSYHLCRFTRSLSIHSLLNWLSLVHSCISYHLLSFLVICDNNHI